MSCQRLQQQNNKISKNGPSTSHFCIILYTLFIFLGNKESLQERITDIDITTEMRKENNKNLSTIGT